MIIVYCETLRQAICVNYPLVKGGLAAGRQWTEVCFSTPFRNLKADAQLKNLTDPSVDSLGTVIILKEKTDCKDRTSKSSGVRYSFRDFIHRSNAMVELVQHARRLAGNNHDILLEGESGTGKEVLAQAIHRESSRSNQPFIALNCAALPKDLIQSELFGYERGAFTGANQEGKIGKFEQAHLGTIFLDEIGDMPFETQVNLLRVLQERVVIPIGGLEPRDVDVRVITATNKRLLDEVNAGNFRRDLYYRLSVIKIRIPPLRDRDGDLWALIEYFVEKHSECRTIDDIEFDCHVRNALERYEWPGNIRELENTIIIMLSKMKGNVIRMDDLPQELMEGPHSSQMVDSLETLECEAIRKALLQCVGNATKAAKVLGIGKSTLYRKLKKYDLDFR